MSNDIYSEMKKPIVFAEMISSWDETDFNSFVELFQLS